MGKATRVPTYQGATYAPLDQSRQNKAWSTHEIALLQQAINHYGGGHKIPLARLEARAAETRRGLVAVRAKVWKLATGYDEHKGSRSDRTIARKKRRRYTRSEIAKLTAMYEAGAGAAQIADALGRSEAAVRTVLVEHFGTSRRAPIQLDGQPTKPIPQPTKKPGNAVDRFWRWWRAA